MLLKINEPNLTIYSIAKKLSGENQAATDHFQEARWLVEHVLGEQNYLANFNQINLNPEQTKKLEELIFARSALHKPIGYLLGNVPFCGLLLETRQPILLPRMETEEWCNHLIEKLKKTEFEKLEIADLCTGSGCIALALAKAFPNSKIIGSDINVQAIELAKKNALCCNIFNTEFLISDLFESIPTEKKFDLIVANPPYLSQNEWTELSPDVQLWEDKAALLAENDGLEFYEKIISQAKFWLKPDGLNWLVLEIGHNQAEKVCEFLIEQGFQINQIFIDSFQKSRAIFSRKK